MTKKRIFYFLFLFLSDLICWGQQSPSAFPGLQIWLSADQGIELASSNHVAQWNDQSGQGRNAVQLDATYQPTLIASEINGLPAVHLNGLQYMSFPIINDCRTLFWVIRDSTTQGDFAARSLLGHSDTFNFFRGENGKIWDPLAGNAITDGVTKLNLVAVNGQTTALPQQYAIVSLTTTGPIQADLISMAHGVIPRTWRGGFAELIVYNQLLSSEQVLNIETYLASKYSPIVVANVDVNAENLCATNICAPEGFTDYSWSNGDVTPCTVVLPGQYQVEVVDAFNRHQFINYAVHGPGNMNLPDTSVFCVGGAFEWDTQLDTSLFNVLWSNDTNGPSFSSNVAGDFSLQVTDPNGCSVVKSFRLEVDSLSALVELGSQLELCAGNVLTLPSTLNGELSILWNDGSANDSLQVFSSGNFSVSVFDTNGCSGSDTVSVVVLGQAPEIAILGQDGCALAEELFSGSVVSNDIITSWEWTLEGSLIGNEQILGHAFATAGNYQIGLSGLATSGCRGFANLNVVVHPNPVALFNYSLPCAGSSILFQDQSELGNAPLELWEWNIDGSFFSGSQVTTQLIGEGIHNIAFSVRDTFGCVASNTIPVIALGKPQSLYSAENQCFGSLTAFHSLSLPGSSGGIVDYQWDFGDNTGSSVNNPTHFFPYSNAYDVRLIVKGQNGCRDTSFQSIVIYPIPHPDFSVSNACLGVPFQFVPFDTTSNGDLTSSYHWTFAQIGTSEDQQPWFSFAQLGAQNVSLQVQTVHGCSGSVSHSVSVWPLPVASFDWELLPDTVNQVRFYNTSQGSNLLFEWTNTAQIFSTESQPIHTFLQSGTTDVTLTARNIYGCRASVTHAVVPDVPRLDLALSSLDLHSTSNGQTSIIVSMVNSGNVVVRNAELNWQAGGEIPVTEHWTGELRPGQNAVYTYSSSFNIGQAELDYLCAQTTAKEVALVDIDPDNNTVCTSVDNAAVQLYPPFPNPGDDKMFVRVVNPVVADMSLKVVSASGQTMLEFVDAAVSPGFHQFFLDISSLSDGNYKLVLVMGQAKRFASFEKIGNR